MQKIARATAVIVSTFILSSIASAAGRSIYVSTDGTDNASCGAQTSACRSISQGLENAVDGDTILVGAGRYGNISGSASCTGPGDEHPQSLSRSVAIFKVESAFQHTDHVVVGLLAPIRVVCDAKKTGVSDLIKHEAA